MCCWRTITECIHLHLLHGRQSLLYTLAVWYSLLFLGYRLVPHLNTLNTTGSCDTVKFLYVLNVSKHGETTANLPDDRNFSVHDRIVCHSVYGYLCSLYLLVIMQISKPWLGIGTCIKIVLSVSERIVSSSFLSFFW